MKRLMLVMAFVAAGFSGRTASAAQEGVVWSTYAGGDFVEMGGYMALDGVGNTYLTGITMSTGWVSGGFDTSLEGGSDGVLVKISPQGQHLWSAYLGGIDFDSPSAVCCDSLGNVFVTGTTSSAGAPWNGYGSAHNGGYDVLLAKLTPAGALAWSAYYGGAGDDEAYGLAIDGVDSIYITGSTMSSGWIANGYDVTYSGARDAFLLKLDNEGRPLWSTYLGGAADDIGASVAVDGAGSACVVGDTKSTGWVSGGFKTTMNNLSSSYADGFAALVSAEGGRLWSTYLGGNNDEQTYDVAVDDVGDFYVTGFTKSSGWTSLGFDASFGGGSADGYVVKVSTSGRHLWSTYVGGSGFDLCSAVVIADQNSAYVTGETASQTWVQGGFDTQPKGGSDAFVLKLTPQGGHAWSGYVGGANADGAMGIAVDAAGNMTISGLTKSPGWVANGFDTTLADSDYGDLFVAQIAGGQAAGADKLTVTITPPQAVAAGAQWRRVGTGAWLDSGATETGVSLGSHQVEFKPLGGWITPAVQGVTLNGAKGATATGAYRLAGALRVTITPPEAAGSGAQWRRVGTTTWLDSGATENGIVTGTQTIEFKSISGWTAPASQTVSITACVTAQASATYAPVQAGVNWGTYLAGSDMSTYVGYGDFIDLRGLALTVDDEGNVLACGSARSTDWVSGGADLSYNGGASDAYVVKISPTGQHLWSTFLGGSAKDIGTGIAVDSMGDVYVTGRTASAGWVSNGFDTEFGGKTDAFVAKLSRIGQHIWSTYAGDANDDGGYAIAANGAGFVCITGQTTSPDWIWGGYDTSLALNSSSYGLDAFALKLTTDGVFEWSTYLGGDLEDCGSAVAMAEDGSVYVTGATVSPGWMQKGFDVTLAGISDAFAVALSATGGLKWGAYLGGSGSEWGQGIAVDSMGYAYVTGYTDSTGWAVGGYDTTHGGLLDAFLIRLNPTGGRSWSTYLGGAGNEMGRAIAVDRDGECCVTGSTSSSGWVSGGFSTVPTESFLARLASDGGHLWSSYLGEFWSSDTVAFDSKHNIVVGGCVSNASSWIKGGYDTVYNGWPKDRYVAMIRMSGSLRVSITPPAAVNAGARWRPVGSSTWFSGLNLPVPMPVGEVELEFMPMEGWSAPGTQVVNVHENSETAVTANYEPSCSSLQVAITPPEAVAAGAQWRRVGSSTWLDSGVIDTSAPLGPAQVEFRSVWGWTAPASIPVTVVDMQPCQASADYVRQSGSVAVTLTPPEAVSAGARWRRAGTTAWLESGASDPVPWGTASIEFLPISGAWTTPATRSVFVDPGQPTAVSAAYGALGDLVVNILPAEAVTAGAQWRRVGTTTWRSSGVAETAVAAGNHTIEFKTLSGWNAPANASVTVLQGVLNSAAGSYVRQTGSLRITLSPSAAVAAGAQWRRVGQSAWLNSGEAEASIPTGSYTVEFKPAPGWFPPANASFTVNNNQETAGAGTYTAAGSLTVAINPPEAVAAGAKWRRAGTTPWFDSGATDSSVNPGSCTVEFSSAPGWSTPANISNVTIVAGQTTSRATTYTQALESLSWSSYAGGSDADIIYGVGIDASGNVIVAGSTSSVGWITGPGMRTSLNGYTDGFVIKLTREGQPVWSTYLGGSGVDYCYALAADAAGAAYVTGRTTSTDAWVANGYDTSFGGGSYDAFAMKLDASGQHAWSTFLGAGYDDEGYAIAVDGTGAAYVAGNTYSPGWVNGGWRTYKTYSYERDGFAVKLSPTGQHVWSTYLGGAENSDYAYGIAVAASGRVYVVGSTGSSGWVSGGFLTTPRSSFTGYVACLDGAGKHVYSSYVGGTGSDYARAVAVDGAGNVAVAGVTYSSGWLSGGGDTTLGGSQDGFVLKIDPAGKLLWGTHLGGSSTDYCTGVAMDASGRIFATGNTSSAGWLSGGHNPNYDGGGTNNNGDAFVARLSAQGTFIWGTYLGGSLTDNGLAIATDGAGSAAVAGNSSSLGWTSGGYDVTHGGATDGFIARLQDLSPPSAALSVTLSPPEAVAEGAAWRRVGSTAWRASGELETALQAGPAAVEFKPVAGWLTPANLSLTLAELQTLTTATAYLRQPGAIQVTITPPAAVAAGAAWRRVGTTNWLNSGDTDHGLNKGTYAIEFKPLAGWTAPVNQDVAVEYAQTSQVSADYVRQVGSLTVTLTPAAAASAGAAWRRVGTTDWLASGQTETGIPIGDLTIEFKPVPLWTTPANQSLSISTGQTASTSAAYGPLADLGVSIQPPAAVAAGAQWRLQGQTEWRDSDTTLTGLASGQVVWVEFKSLYGWTAPSMVSMMLPQGRKVTISGTYVRQTGGLSVTILPAEAAAAGAQWRRVGTSQWLDSGAVDSPVNTGPEMVEFKPAPGWLTPADQSVNITTGYTSPLTATYIRPGSIRVSLTPAEAVTAGAQWRRAGTSDWRDSGAAETGLTPGAYAVEYKPVTGWNAPANAAVNVAQGTTATLSGAYVRQTGGLSVTILPPEAAAAGAKWRRVGAANWLASGATENGIAIGSCQVEFSPVTGWTAPSPANATIADGSVATVSASYVRRPGSLSVALSPSAAVTAGAQWRRKGSTTWLNSGARENGVEPGDYSVEFKDLAAAHWTAPPQMAVTVASDQLTTLGASYFPRLVVSSVTPVAVAAAPGAAATFTVSAVGAPTLKYQWKKDGVAIAGATAATYRISACALTHAGVYVCEVSNGYIRADSPQFRLAVAKSAAVIRYLLGLTTNPAGLDLNGDSKVDVADVLKGLK